MAQFTTETVHTGPAGSGRGLDIEVRRGGSGPPLIWFHGLVGLANTEPTLERLAESFEIAAPIWPGYGELDNEGAIEDMLDFALLGWDIVDALGMNQPHVVGHSFGAMIAAEMASIARHDLAKLALVTPFGLWLDAHPITDPFAMLPFELTELLFADPVHAEMLLPPGLDMESDEGLAQFMISNSRRLGTAGKIMFPIPNRRLSKRLYRVEAPARIFLAEGDQLITEPYGQAWADHINQATVETITGAGHMINLEKPEELSAAIAAFLAA